MLLGFNIQGVVLVSPFTVNKYGNTEMRWAGHVALMDKARGLYRVLLRKPEGKRPLG